MLKFLTHKLRTHSINEDHRYVEKVEDDDHDSGTESDEELEPAATSPDRLCSVSPADTGCSMESPAPDQHDPHSSEEELEVINGNTQAQAQRTVRPLRAASVCLPEKRKWSQVGDHHRFSPENEENMSHYSNLSPTSSSSPYLRTYGDEGHVIEHSGSSDDEVHNLLGCSATPVRFRTSPPLEAVKPGRRAAVGVKGMSISPPSKLLHYEVSPRKRSRHARSSHLQRPYLDFEKMQQLKARSVTSWRPGGEHVGELSVFCW
ncbi:uncharacterized protein LOC132704308 [Cylas formicarius]|uniref:uncharacterized protein LOC132704308 n=1 Tax=Cylas formicarius TaxID=197179 RepID=UPI0029588527|nr:uncharacterized protein LOC132704308 [Cylas formicarius]